MQDQQLFRLVCYVRSTLSYRQYAWVGDSRADLSLHLFTDADLASDPEDSVSTSGAYFAAVARYTHVPIAQRSKKQTCVSHSTPEAELVSADHGLRTIGLPALDLWECLLGSTPRLLMFQDNDACCTICRTGRNPSMPYINRTHRISAAWMHHQLQHSGIGMYRADSELMAADIFTKAFPEVKRSIWNANLRLINVYDSLTVDADISYDAECVRSLRGDMTDLRLNKVEPTPGTPRFW